MFFIQSLNEARNPCGYVDSFSLVCWGFVTHISNFCHHLNTSETNFNMHLKNLKAMCRCTHTLQILTWTETRHQPFQSTLHGAALTGPTAALGSEATSSFPPPCGGQAAHSGRADIWPPRLPGTGWTWSPPRCSTWSDSPCSLLGRSQRWSPVNGGREIR